jgi:UDP-N-acetylmuramate dehydrogenase
MSDPLLSFASILRENVSLAPFTWLQIGGPTRYLAEPSSVQELEGVVAACFRNNIPVRVLGGGSNLLVREAGFSGTTLLLSSPAFGGINRDGNLVRCGAGVKLSHLITYCVGEGLSGLEHLVAIPGTVGGAVRGNAATEEGDMGHAVISAKVLGVDGAVREVPAEQLAFSHRASGMDGIALVEVTFALTPADPRALTKREQTFWILKRRIQPGLPERTALAFVDPVGFKASDLIQQVGLVGTSEGGIRLSSTFPNYLIASTNATSSQVLSLLERVRKAVMDRSGVQLQYHLQIW